MLQNKILFVHNSLTEFIQLDLDILRSEFPVSEYPIYRRHFSTREILKKVKQHDLVFGWFASWHTFLPILFARMQRKPSILVTGGYDLANLPVIKYGNQRGGLKKWISRLTLRLATLLVVNSYFSQTELARNAGISAKRAQVIYHGIPDFIEKLPEKTPPHLVITVGNVEQDNLLRKGHLPFARASHLLPDLPFVLIGKARDMSGRYLRDQAGDNFKLTGFISHSELNAYYCRASVSVQASLHEAFGISVAEAMLAGCIPVVSSNGALPEVVGDTGIIIDTINPHAIASAIKQAIAFPESERQRVRERILTHFPLEKRKQELIQLVGKTWL